MPVTLSFDAPGSAAFTKLAEADSLVAKAAQFSRIVSLIVGGTAWTEARMLHLLTQPCMQQVTWVSVRASWEWMENPSVQTALFSLPQLKSVEMAARSRTKLFPNAVVLASKLRELTVDVRQDPASTVCALRALRSFPALTSLNLQLIARAPHSPSVEIEQCVREIVWCLPGSLQELHSVGFAFPLSLPRPLIKALWLRVPALESVVLDGDTIQPMLRGLLDAEAALPKLRDVWFQGVESDIFVWEQEVDPLPPLLRRFLHRFPQAGVRFEILDEIWDQEALMEFCVRFLAWPRVEIYSMESGERFGAPLRPQPSDDEDGSDVEVWDEQPTD